MFAAKVQQITQLDIWLKVATWCVCSRINKPALEPVDERFVNRTRDLHHIFMWSAEHHNSMDVCRPNVAGQLVTWLKKPAKKPFLAEEEKVLDSLSSLHQSILWTEHMSGDIRCLPSRRCVCVFNLRVYSTLVCKTCVIWHSWTPMSSSGLGVCAFVFQYGWLSDRGDTFLRGCRLTVGFGQMLTSTYIAQ